MVPKIRQEQKRRAYLVDQQRMTYDQVEEEQRLMKQIETTGRIAGRLPWNSIYMESLPND